MMLTPPSPRSARRSSNSVTEQVSKAYVTGVFGLTQEMGTTLGSRPEVAFYGPIDNAVPQQVSDHLQAVLREALTNAGKYAGASTYRVTLTLEEDLVLEVSDDGTGIRPAIARWWWTRTDQHAQPGRETRWFLRDCGRRERRNWGALARSLLKQSRLSSRPRPTDQVPDRPTGRLAWSPQGPSQGRRCPTCGCARSGSQHRRTRRAWPCSHQGPRR
jgi:hypothetical protein